ncbi:hypothetical protein IWQ62_005512 [Dispira parvispora]|uniref:Transcription factor CBF/NF-Y/archaeal histone domain-containing protein n=1 Tax=Dispira parvispora TaxID=1520584 RepID=A0A9W8AQT5_9FUNG|nr:hypothetical protein IWQ62_005512 [Dispira parvispora]
MTKLYSRSLLRKIIKTHEPQHRLSSNVDVMVYLDYLLFLSELSKEAQIVARGEGQSEVSSRHLQRAADLTLRRFKG